MEVCRHREELTAVTSETRQVWAEKAPTGVSGLDYLLRGGLPSHRIHLVEGHRGRAKRRSVCEFS
jgi:RecA/RadA recombinase